MIRSTTTLLGVVAVLLLNGVNAEIKDVIAQGACTGLYTGKDYISAVNRGCSDTSAPCETVCKDLGKFCFNALHIYSVLKVYKYDSCTSTGCGPNYCCCSNNAPAPTRYYKEEIAQAACTALNDAAGYVSAVSRQCSVSNTDACDSVCSELGKTCFESIHVYDKSPLKLEDKDKVGLKAYRYGSCSSGGCGPNFCCCSG